jgi:hypothetical protein
MKCKNCGAPLDEGALFCRRCGTAAPKTPEPAGKRTVKMNASSGASDRIRDLAARTGAWFSGTFDTIRGRFGGLRDSKLFRNRRLLMLAGAGAALLLVLIIVIASAASCRKQAHYQTTEELTAAVIDALDAGDGNRLYKMSKLAHKTLGEHKEIFGEGSTPEAVMEGYYKRLTYEVNVRRAEIEDVDGALNGQLETRIVTDTSIYETNRALGLEATQYAEITGLLLEEDAFVANLRIVAVELDGEWRLLVVYIY